MQLEQTQLKERSQISADKKQVFIVDDDTSVCRALKLLMTTYGFAVDTFLSSEEFFSAVPNSTPGCLILDLQMPGLNGWETQKLLRRADYQRPVIMITGDKTEGLKERALEAGVVGFLQKPFNDQELVDLIDLASLNS
jgi:FixJ family two-component response regulator